LVASSADRFGGPPALLLSAGSAACRCEQSRPPPAQSRLLHHDVYRQDCLGARGRAVAPENDSHLQTA